MPVSRATTLGHGQARREARGTEITSPAAAPSPLRQASSSLSGTAALALHSRLQRPQRKDQLLPPLVPQFLHDTRTPSHLHQEAASCRPGFSSVSQCLRLQSERHSAPPRGLQRLDAAHLGSPVTTMCTGLRCCGGEGAIPLPCVCPPQLAQLELFFRGSGTAG